MSKDRLQYQPPPEGLAVIFKHNTDIAVVRQAENSAKDIRFGERDLPRETRERQGNFFEPLTTTLERVLQEELGIENWKEKGIKPTKYSSIDCSRPDGTYIKAHIVVLDSPDPVIALSDPKNIDSTEIMGVEMLPLTDVVMDVSNGWRTGPDGRDLVRAIFPPEKFEQELEASKEIVLLRSSD